VAFVAHRPDGSRLIRIGLHLAAQPSDADLDGAMLECRACRPRTVGHRLPFARGRFRVASKVVKSTNPNMEIRLFEGQDVESVTDLLHDMSRHYNRENASTRSAVRAHLLERMLGPKSGVTLVVALSGARVVGLAAISILYPAPKERGQLFMKELYVHSDCRGEGIGEQLMVWIARYAIHHDCVRFDWTAESNNPGAVRFYSALGARRVEEKIYFRFEGEDLSSLARHDA
jgi:ribosomal protein S18 acetylase RimI-like enzyme